MSSRVSIQKRINQLRKAGADLDDILYRTAKNATLRAIEAAQDATPPKKGTGRGPYIGTNTVTGELKAHWDTDSKKEPMGGALSGGSTYVTVLANDLQYASYVNDGHRMDRHFVPGLVINEESGMLEFNPDGSGGIVVGTKTAYVPGVFMVDAAKEEYRRVLRKELQDIGDEFK